MKVIKYVLAYIGFCISVLIPEEGESFSFTTMDLAASVLYAAIIFIIGFIYSFLDKHIHKIKRQRRYVILSSITVTVLICGILILLQKLLIPIFGGKGLETSTLLFFPIFLFFGVLLNASRKSTESPPTRRRIKSEIK